MKPINVFLFLIVVINYFVSSVHAEESTLTRYDSIFHHLDSGVIPLDSLKKQEPKCKITGFLMDSTTRKPIEFGTVHLKMSEGQISRSAISQADGSFTLIKIPPGSYQVSFSMVGYNKRNILISVDTAKEVLDMGRIALESGGEQQLKEVVISADRPIVKQEVDRITYDVQADPESKVQNVLDMMRKVPLLSVDGDDKIKLKGSGDYKILIDGRPSSLVARNPDDVFRSMPASNILRIEVITTPPAKYDSEGLAGLINIITNRRALSGYNGSVGLRENLLFGPGVSGFVAVKKRKIGFSTNGAVNFRQPRTSLFSNSRINSSQRTNFQQSGERALNGVFPYGSGEFSYEADSLNLITASFSYNGLNAKMENSSTNYVFETDGSLNQSYTIDNVNEYNRGGLDAGVNYQLGFKKLKDQLLTSSYKFISTIDETSTSLTISDRVSYSQPDYLQRNKTGADEHTFQVDYVRPLKKINIEAGLKGIVRNNYSDYGRQDYDEFRGQFVVNNANTNKFNYQQNVYSFYNSYHLKSQNWSFKTGLRLEKTVINADFISQSQSFKTDYDKLIPSVAIQRQLKNRKSLNIGYTQRIQRPSIWQLSPFEDKNDKFITSGNSSLEPVLNHNFDLSYTMFKKGSITSGLSYSFANNTIQYVSRIDGDTTRTTYENIGENQNFGLNINTNYPVTKRLDINVNSRLSYIWVNGFLYNKIYKNEGIQGYANVYASYKFNHDMRAGVSLYYLSPTINLQGKVNSFNSSTFSLSKDFLKKKVNFSASVNNPFNRFRTWKNVTTTPEFSQSTNYRNFHRQVNLAFNYKFGKLKDSIKKNKRGINNDDLMGKSAE